jgi:SPP1 family predicted phage head-tail adaptor
MENLSKELPDIGALDERLNVYEFLTSRDEYGAEVKQESVILQIWCRVEGEGRLSENYQADQKTAFARKQFTIRWQPGIREWMLLEYEGEKYEIIGIDDIGRKRFHKITAERRRT